MIAPRSPQAPRGFTLVELIVVVAVFAVIGGIAISVFLSILTGRAKAQARAEMQEHARLAVSRLVYEIRRARGVEVASDFGVNLATTPSATVELDMTVSGNDPTVFSVVGGVLYLQQGANPAVALTSDDVVVSNLTFDNRTVGNGRSKNIAFTLTVLHSDPTGGSVDLVYSLDSAAELRGK